MGAELRARSGILLAAVLLSAPVDPVALGQSQPDTYVDGDGAVYTEVPLASAWDDGEGLIDDIHPIEVDVLSVVAPQGDQQGSPPSRTAAPAPTAAELQLDLQSRLKDVQITATPEGYVVHVRTDSGLVELTPDEYVRALGATQARVDEGGFLYRVLNISRPWSFAWICVGLLGQLMFTFRMLLQWWTSEKHKRSIVPVGFWWGSLIGGAMLFAYFCWRKDIVGILGQSTGVFIYARNLVLIYRRKASDAGSASGADEHPNLPAARPL
jgi:lipid-A-disaccharide synthase-like uncharacterized protein